MGDEAVNQELRDVLEIVSEQSKQLRSGSLTPDQFRWWTLLSKVDRESVIKREIGRRVGEPILVGQVSLSPNDCLGLSFADVEVRNQDRRLNFAEIDSRYSKQIDGELPSSLPGSLDVWRISLQDATVDPHELRIFFRNEKALLLGAGGLKLVWDQLRRQFLDSGGCWVSFGGVTSFREAYILQARGELGMMTHDFFQGTLGKDQSIVYFKERE